MNSNNDVIAMKYLGLYKCTKRALFIKRNLFNEIQSGMKSAIKSMKKKNKIKSLANSKITK